MSDFQKQLIFELSKKYTFETFDFQSKSPEDLILEYQNVSEKISKIIEDQDAEIAKHNHEIFKNLNF